MSLPQQVFWLIMAVIFWILRWIVFLGICVMVTTWMAAMSLRAWAYRFNRYCDAKIIEAQTGQKPLPKDIRGALLLIVAIGLSGCGSSPTYPTASMVPLTVRVVSHDHYILVHDEPIYAPLAHVSVELRGGMTRDTRRRDTAADGTATWRVAPGFPYTVRVQGKDYFGNLIGGPAEWLALVCGINLPNTYLIDNLTVPC